jgi:RNA-directed DNA polymerase
MMTRFSRRDQGIDTLTDSLVASKMCEHGSPRQGEWLKRVVDGFFNYHAVPTNSRALATFRQQVIALWRRMLRRRSQKDDTTWERIVRLADEWLPKPRILHPWPNERFAVKHPR